MRDEDGVEVVGEAHNGVEALRKVTELRPPAALLDTRMPRMVGVELIRRLAFEHPQVATLVATFEGNEYLFGGRGEGSRSPPACQWSGGVARLRWIHEQPSETYVRAQGDNLEVEQTRLKHRECSDESPGFGKIVALENLDDPRLVVGP